ncbi:hypothetical protein ACXR2U_03685 [Jatrophihabitans sp. YIM 134969]
MRRPTWSALIGVTVALTLAGCTEAVPDTTSTPTPTTAASTVRASSSPPPTTAVVAGPTTTADGTCPLLPTAKALEDLGERLGRVTVSTSDGRPVGCTFYPASGPLASSEHLPPPTVPVIAITVSRFADTTAAHNAMVVSTEADPAAYSNPATGVDEGISFVTDFLPEDGGQDSAYTFRKATTVVQVQIAQTKATLTAELIGSDVAAAVS